LTDERQRIRYQPKRRAWYRTTWFATLVVVAFVAVVAVIAVIPVWATSTPTYCSSCKATRAAGASWKQSTHASVSCTECHVPPGVAPAVKWRAREWLNVWADYLNVPHVSNKGQAPTNANCLQCHTLDNIPSDNGAVRMPHAMHINQRNLRCFDCHDEVAHPKPGQKGTGVSMATCSMCHEQTTQPSQCGFCHLDHPSPQVHPASYLQTHGKEALADPQSCSGCHQQSFCNDCHSKPPADHFSATWSYAHGTTATKHPLSCVGCHSPQEFCQQCHQVQHPAGWMQSHGPIAAKSANSCLVCHPQSMCDQCHQRMGVKVP
jgi:nitrate/TMAO reductase-like tetraheme cytochrome c subunit